MNVQRVTRPRGGVNEWLHWLPVSLHKKLVYLIRQIILLTASLSRSNKLAPLPLENGSSGAVGLASVLEADVHQIVTIARQSYDKYFLFYCPVAVYLTCLVSCCCCSLEKRKTENESTLLHLEFI